MLMEKFKGVKHGVTIFII